MENIRKDANSSDIEALDLAYSDNWYGGICFLGANSVSVTIIDSVFRNISSHCIGLESSALILSTSIFNNTGIVSSSYSQSDNDYNGVSWIIIDGGTNDVGSGFLIGITENQFIGNTLYPSKGGAIRVIGTYPIKLKLENNQFIDNGAYNGGAIYIENIYHAFEISGDYFSNNIALTDGGALSINCQNLGQYEDAAPSLKLTSVTFESNAASARGGAIYAYQEIISISESFFYQNSAKNGGAIFALKSVDSLDYLQYNNTFQDNAASLSGGALKLLFDYSVLGESLDAPNMFENNQDWKGLAISEGTPESYQISIFGLVGEQVIDSTTDLKSLIENSNLTVLEESLTSTKNIKPVSQFKMSQKSGHDIEYIIMIEIYDNQGKLCDYISDEQVQISFSSWENNKSNFEPNIEGTYGYASFQNGRLLLKAGLVLIGDEQTVANLTIQGESETSYFLNAVDNLLYQNLLVEFRDCEIGDIYNSITKRYRKYRNMISQFQKM